MKTGRPKGSGNIPLEQRFEKYISPSLEDNGCLLWTGAKNPTGYGVIQVYYPDSDIWRTTQATHVSWWYHFDEWPTLWVLHSCDNPPCINPEHLFQGTVGDNNRDMTAKGRNPLIERQKKRLPIRQSSDLTPLLTL